MKKSVLFCVLALLIAFAQTSCSTEQLPTSSVSNKLTPTVSGTIGDQTKTPDLYVPENEQGWQGFYSGMGLRSEGIYTVVKNPTTNDTLVSYSCWIANKLRGTMVDYSGADDFVVNMPQDGIPVDGSSGDYSFTGMLSITSFQNGLPIAQIQKQRFFVVPTDYRVEVDPSLVQQYNYPFMAIPSGTADNYVNKAKVKSGKILVVVEVNPDNLIAERDVSNNVSTLPLMVTVNGYNATNNIIGSAVLDLSAIDENKAHSATNVVVTKDFRGRDKFVKLDWDCPYHVPIYVKHYFTVKKNGLIVKTNFDNSDYTETVKGNYSTSVYEITITVVGLGTSPPTTVTVSK